jgi:hypothetical protein
MESINDFVSTREASEILDLSQTHLGYLARNKMIKARKVGHDWLIYLPSLRDCLASNPRPGIKLGTKLKRGKTRT